MGRHEISYIISRFNDFYWKGRLISKIKSEKKTFSFHLDIDECKANADNCHDDATCTNTKGSFTCACNVGYEGDGEMCTGKIIVWSLMTISCI